MKTEAQIIDEVIALCKNRAMENKEAANRFGNEMYIHNSLTRYDCLLLFAEEIRLSFKKPEPQPVTDDLSEEELNRFEAEIRKHFAGFDGLINGGKIPALRLISELRRWRELAKKQEPHVHIWEGATATECNYRCSCGATKTETITEKQ